MTNVALGLCDYAPWQQSHRVGEEYRFLPNVLYAHWTAVKYQDVPPSTYCPRLPSEVNLRGEPIPVNILERIKANRLRLQIQTLPHWCSFACPCCHRLINYPR